MFRRRWDANFDRIVEQARLRSSFIYLANAVNDLRGNWTVMGLILGPLVLAAALCLLPDAINLQNSLVQTFEPGTRSVDFIEVQAPHVPPVAPAQPTFSRWITIPSHLMLILITFMVNLVVLSAVKRMHAGVRAKTAPMRRSRSIARRSRWCRPFF